MDYVQEELRRQREALARLLLGGIVPQEDAEAAPETAEGIRDPAGQDLGRGFPLRGKKEGAAGAAPETGGLSREFRDAGIFPGLLPEADSLPMAARWPEAAVYGLAGALPEAGGLPRVDAADGGFPGPDLRGGLEWRPSGVLGGAAAALPGVGAAAPARDGGLPVLRGVRQSGPALGAADGGSPWGSGGETASRSQAVISGAGDEGGPERTVTEMVFPPAGGAAGDPKELSRIFQRDARRYDGGFSLF